MASINSGKLYTVLTDYDLSGGMDKATSSIKAENIEKVGCSIIFDSVTSGGTPSADIYLEGSVDGTSWFRTNATVDTVSSSDLSTDYELGFGAKDLFYPYLRLYIDGTAITGGTVTAKIWGKLAS